MPCLAVRHSRNRSVSLYREMTRHWGEGAHMAELWEMFTHGFQGKIGTTRAESEPWWPEAKRAPKGAPNIVIVYMDDMGYADVGCFGSEIDTPNIDALAAR